MSESKTILIVGLGMVGLIHGYALAQAGFEVIHKVREGKTAPEEITVDLLDLRNPEPQNRRERPGRIKRNSRNKTAGAGRPNARAAVLPAYSKIPAEKRWRRQAGFSVYRSWFSHPF